MSETKHNGDAKQIYFLLKDFPNIQRLLFKSELVFPKEIGGCLKEVDAEIKELRKLIEK